MARPPERANRSAIANILGVGKSALGNYTGESNFPVEDDSREFSIRDCVLWWFVWKAPKPKRQAILAELTTSLGLDPEPDSQLGFDFEPAEPMSAKEQRDLLEVTLKAAKIEVELRKLIDVEDMRSILADFANTLSGALSQVEKITGQPVVETIAPAFQLLDERISKYQKTGHTS